MQWWGPLQAPTTISAHTMKAVQWRTVLSGQPTGMQKMVLNCTIRRPAVLVGTYATAATKPVLDLTGYASRRHWQVAWRPSVDPSPRVLC
jgi:hypothetical protein